MNLIEATLKDVPRIEDCARKCCAEHGVAQTGGPLDWDCYRAVLEYLLNKGIGAMWLYEDDQPGPDHGKIVGGLCGVQQCDPLTGLYRASRVFLYVLPDYRKRLSVLRLFRRFEQWARKNRCATMTMSLLTTMPKATKRAYEAMGYAEQETIYLKVLPGLGKNL